eukprot:15439269-Alexandrium_andersonii.AAC.1
MIPIDPERFLGCSRAFPGRFRAAAGVSGRRRTAAKPIRGRVRKNLPTSSLQVFGRLAGVGKVSGHFPGRSRADPKRFPSGA